MDRILLSGLFAVSILADLWLECLNIRHIKGQGHGVPRGLEGFGDAAFIARSRSCFLESSRLVLYEKALGGLLLLLFFAFGLEWYNGRVASMDFSFVGRGLVFYLPLYLAWRLFHLCFRFLKTFHVERRYSFNGIGPGLWILETLRSVVISTAVIAAVLYAGLWLVEKSPAHWWLWCWLLFTFTGFILVYVSPPLMEPIFKRSRPLDDRGLAGEIKKLAKKAGVTIGSIGLMKTSRRTRHTNAYLTGLGRARRIVLYENLLRVLNRDELLSVVAHETGHWKKRHLARHIFATWALTFVTLYLAFRLFNGTVLTESLHIGPPGFFAKTAILFVLLSMASLPLRAVFNMLSREREREADRVAMGITKDPGAMISSLVRLSLENLANLYPHPLYVFFNYSHPPVLERIGLLRRHADPGRMRVSARPARPARGAGGLDLEAR